MKLMISKKLISDSFCQLYLVDKLVREEDFNEAPTNEDLFALKAYKAGIIVQPSK